LQLLVSDNCSPDVTTAVVEQARAAGVPVEYVRNEKNLGWALILPKLSP
jgi:GT2 family glycosyltransferase